MKKFQGAPRGDCRGRLGSWFQDEEGLTVTLPCWCRHTVVLSLEDVSESGNIGTHKCDTCHEEWHLALEGHREIK